jgi:multidrug efflux pump subunit AcrA (membrane-fusion protein)
MAMIPLNPKVIWGALAGGLALFVLALLAFAPHPSEANSGESTGPDDEAVLDAIPEIQTVRPRQNLPTYIQVQEPADVEAFFRADLAALVAGTIKYMPKAIGDTVKKGETLVEVDAPDRVQDVLEKEAIVEQYRLELEVARKKAKRAAAAVLVAEEQVKQKQADQIVADAEKDWRKDIWDRYIGLGREKVVTEDVVEEKRKAYRVADAGTVSARVAVQKAFQELSEERAKAEEADADIKLKESRIAVAKRDLDRARALLGYATITAPFDGMIIRRNADPGDFVQNAATARTEPILSVVRTDIMTVVMKLPDTYAPYVTRDTDVVIQLPGRLIRAKVTRYSHSIHAQDRTMRIEVDLFNGTREEYQRFLRERWGACVVPLAAKDALGAPALLAASRNVWTGSMKGSNDPLPVFPEVPLVNPRGQLASLLPRMYGHMRLLLRDIQDAYLIPAQAVFSLGGKTYILLVEKGKARRQPVKVEMSDGKLAKVTVLTRRVTDDGEIEVAEGLTGKEDIVLSGQIEISDGQAVNATRISDWPTRLKLLRGVAGL